MADSESFLFIFLDPYLASFYPVYSLAENFTNPYYDEVPDKICFKIDIRYVPEGEDDLVRVEILLNTDKNVCMFFWKLFDKNSKSLFIRYKKHIWKLIVNQGSIFQFEFLTSNNNLTCSELHLEKMVGWPEQRNNYLTILSAKNMTAFANYKFHSNQKNAEFFKWFSKSSKDYLEEININVERTLECGRTLLHYAARMENIAFIKALLPKFSNVDVPDKELKTPLHHACEVGNYEVVKLLLESNANANLRTTKGLTGLMITAKRRMQNKKMVKLLIKFYASIHAETADGMRAIDYARQVDTKSPIIPLLHSVIKY